eukprot:9870_1
MATGILTSLINSFKRNIDEFQCICGSVLQKEDAQLLYGKSQGAICDICKTDPRSVELWHCPQEYNIFHPDGYDICNNCRFVTELPRQEENQEYLISKSFPCAYNVNCSQLQTIITILNQYSANDVNATENMDQSQLVHHVNTYLHLIHEHDDDTSFQAIFDKLQFCDAAKCSMLQRNNRNRLQSAAKSAKYHYNVAFSIMDKMHCYFHHSYDRGYRRSHNIAISDQKMPSDASVYVETGCAKYQTLFEEPGDVQDSNSFYEFGMLFEYGYDGELGMPMFSEKISQVHQSFKEELIQNKICRLNVDQYRNEYDKALIFIQSAFCKRNSSFQPHVREYGNTILKRVKWELQIEYLLAVMIYCNYTTLQHEFSKTYRENDGEDHCHFYHFGKCLKIAVHHFGTRLKDLSVQKFYHGVSHKLYLPSYTHYGIAVGISIFGPLSTSSVRQVAMAFATHHGVNGLIVELMDSNFTRDKCFPAAWLSDYPHEKEHLFLQCVATLTVSNIIEITTGFEYECVLNATRLFHDVICANYEAVAVVNELYKALTHKMCEHQLSVAMPSRFKPFEGTQFA